MLMNWRQFIKDSGAGLRELAKLSPGTMKGYRALHDAGSETNRLDPATRELIALAVAVTTRCDGCIADHTKNAIAMGLSKEQIAEAIGVAVAMNAGAALAYAGRVLDAYTTMSEPSSARS
jgi:AhpD family alkylhydroperoxidase